MDFIDLNYSGLETFSIHLDTENHELCVKECTTSIPAICPDESGNFKIKNLFGELKTDYLKTIARENLGIADEFNLRWGSIKGILENQTDLINFVSDLISKSETSIVNNKIIWGKINGSILNLNDLTTYISGLLQDQTTLLKKYVNEQVINGGGGSGYASGVQVSPEYMLYGQNPTSVTVSWNLVGDIKSLNINGVQLALTAKSYTFNNVSKAFTITLKYTTDEEHTVTREFELKYPTFYGTSSNYLQCLSTGNNTFTVPSGEYIYIMSPYLNTYFNVNGFNGGFTKTGSTLIYNHFYYIYKSVNSNLGDTKITLTYE